ncbi:MAG: thiol peroxidase [Anaerolineales bacterium]|nr:thiol peroxidase [Anaerolineales bacterium]
MTTERKDDLTFKGNPLTVMGEQVSVGDKAPDFELVDNGMQTVTLANTAGKVRLISVVPSLDTGICDAQTRRMNEEAAKLGDKVAVLTVSAEHPFNQKRWCGAAGIDAVQVLSDHQSMSFGQAYGTYIKEWRLEQRAMFVVDENDVVRYVEYVPEVAQHPDYEAVLAAVAEVAG